jgi:hypothetical protein
VRKDPGLERLIQRGHRVATARYTYARRSVPPNAIGVVLEFGKKWYWVTPAMQQDDGAWRLSYGSEIGAHGHATTDWKNRPFLSKYDAIMEALYMDSRVRVTEYILPGGQHVQVGRVRPNRGRPQFKNLRRR